MKILNSLPGLLILSFAFWSCSVSTEQSTDVQMSYELKTVDSVQIDLLARYLAVVDVQAKTGNLLVIRSQENIAYVISPEGKILSTMDRPKDDPQAVGVLVSGEFFEDGIALMGRFLVKTYDMDFNLRKSLKPQYPPTQLIYGNMNHLFEVPAQGGNKLLSYVGAPQTEYFVTHKEFYEEFNIFDLIDPGLVEETSAGFSKEESLELFKPLGAFAPDSRYLKGRAFYMMRAIFDVKEQSAFYAFSTDTTLYEMALPEGNVVNEYRIPFDDFILFSGYTMGPEGIAEQSQRRPEGLAGKIENLYRVDDLTLLAYRSGLNNKKLEELDFSSPDYYERMMRTNKKKILILKDGKRVNGDMTFPEKIGTLQMADDMGFIWGSQNLDILDEEPEVITLYKLRVVKSK